MKRAVVCALVLLLLAAGCASMLEGEQIVVTPHSEPYNQPQNGQSLSAADYDELRAAVYDLVLRRADTGSVIVYGYGGMLDADIEQIITDITKYDAFGAYAVESINVETVLIVSYVQLEFDVTYRRTGAQIASVITVATEEELTDELMRVLTDYRSEAAVLTTIPGVTSVEITDKIMELYYSNPLKIVMLPVTEALEYPENPEDTRLVEIQFGYSQNDTVLRAFSRLLDTAAHDVAERVEGETDTERARSLCALLGEIAAIDTATASVPEYSTLNFSTTAYGALLGGSANSEGYAMAYKALCDVLGYDCAVVTGSRDGRRCAWNLVTTDGAAYHLDPALCDEEGEDAHFMLDDDEMLLRGYNWDREKYHTNENITENDGAAEEEG